MVEVKLQSDIYAFKASSVLPPHRMSGWLAEAWQAHIPPTGEKSAQLFLLELHVIPVLDYVILLYLLCLFMLNMKLYIRSCPLF